MDKKQITQAIQQIENGLAILKRSLEIDRPAAVKPKAKAEPYPKFALAESAPASELGPTPDWLDPAWPEAVPSRLIVSENSSEQEKKFRALQIIGLLSWNIRGANCLDLGCGAGHMAAEMTEKANSVVGYDIKSHPSWQNLPNVRFTTNKAEINSGFDFILCYDVFDHIINEHPVDVFSWASQLLTPNGAIAIRVHPWTSRHGSHSYEMANKAYIHLALTPAELQAAGIPVDCALHLARPMAAYEAVFRRSGLTVIDKQITLAEPDEYFEGRLLDRINKITWGGNITPEVARKIIGTQFIDYTLQRV